MVLYNFFEGLHPSRCIQGAINVNGYGAIYRPWGKQGGVESQLKFGKFFISRTHCLWDVVGILLGRAVRSVRSPDFKAFGGGVLGREPTLSICIK